MERVGNQGPIHNHTCTPNYLVVPSLAVNSTCLPHCRSDNHHSDHGKLHCILPHHH